MKFLRYTIVSAVEKFKPAMNALERL